MRSRAKGSAFRLVLLTAVAAALTGAAAPPPSQPAAPGAAPPEPAILAVFNRPIIILRASIFSIPPAERAAKALERITSALEREPIPPISTSAITEGTLIRIGDRDAFVIMPGDVDLVAGESYDDLVARTVQRLEQVVADIEKQRQWPFLLRAVAAVIGATAAFVIAVAAIRRLGRWLRPRMARLEENAGSRLRRAGLDLLGQLAATPHLAATVVVWAALAVCTYSWLVFSLKQFPYTEPWGEGLGAFLATTLSSLALGILRAVPNLFVVVVIVMVTRFGLKVVKSFFSAVEERRAEVTWLDPDAARATSQIVAVVVWLFALVMIYPYLPGSGSLAFQGMSLLLGVLVSLGATNLVGQFTSGLVLMYSRAVRAGEYVRFAEHEGTITSLGFLSTRIQTKKNEEVSVPNSVLLGSTITNYSRLAGSQPLLLHTSVTIGYDAPWRQVHALLIEAANRTPGLGRTPAPFVLQTALSDFYVEYQLNACIDQPSQRLATLALLHQNIQDQFNEHGVQIMSPHFVADKSEPVVVPKEIWYARPARPPADGS